MRLKVKELISWWIVQLLLQLDQTNNPIIADTSLMLHICIETNLNFDQKSDGNEPILMKIIKILSSAWVCVIRSVIWIQPCNLPEITFAEGQNLECFPGIDSRQVGLIWWNECDEPSYWVWLNQGRFRMSCLITMHEILNAVQQPKAKHLQLPRLWNKIRLFRLSIGTVKAGAWLDPIQLLEYPIPSSSAAHHKNRVCNGSRKPRVVS